MKKIGFVIPVYNSEATLNELYTRIIKVVDTLQCTYQLVLINDKSLDNSWNELIKIKKNDSDNVTIINLSRNSGQHNAIFCGLHYCSTEFILTLDDDLQTPPEESIKLYTKITEGNQELVYGVYSHKRHSIFRNFGSAAVQFIFSFVFNSKGNISSFRIFKNSLKERILKYKTTFLFIDGFLHWETIKIGRIVVDHNDRKYGRSGYSLGKLLKLTANLIFNFTTIPLTITIYLGAICSLISFCLGIVFIIRKLIYDVPLGYTSLVVIILFSTGMILTVIGFIGEYLRRLYLSSLSAPQYSIEEIH